MRSDYANPGSSKPGTGRAAQVALSAVFLGMSGGNEHKEEGN